MMLLRDSGVHALKSGCWPDSGCLIFKLQHHNSMLYQLSKLGLLSLRYNVSSASAEQGI